MSQPGLHVLLEVELLQGVELASATSHHMRVARDRVRHVEVVDVLDQSGAVHLAASMNLVSVLLEARGLDHVEAQEMRAELSEASTQLINSVIR